MMFFRHLATVAAVLCFSGFASSQTVEQATPPALPATVPAEDSPTLVMPPTGAQAPADDMAEKWEAAFATKLEAMNLGWQTLEQAIWIAGWIGIVIVGLAVIFAFFGFKSLRDIETNAQIAARAAVDQSFREKSGIVTDLMDEAKRVNSLLSQLEKVATELAGYQALAETAQSATRFDPLVEFYSLRPEIETRSEKWRNWQSGDKSIKVEETVADSKFRQRAAVVFERLLAAASADANAGKARLSTVDFYNLAAAASEAQLAFVSLELMEIAARQNKNLAPEIEARLVRQRLAASRISRAEAIKAMGAVLQRVNGFDLHHVVSEAFNVAQHSADPAGMSRLIDASLSEHLNTISYTLLVRAELLFMADTINDWHLADQLTVDGIAALQLEGVEARWFESSMRQVMKLTRDQSRRETPPIWQPAALKLLTPRRGGQSAN